MMQMQIAMFRPELPPCVKSLSLHIISQGQLSPPVCLEWRGGETGLRPARFGTPVGHFPGADGDSPAQSIMALLASHFAAGAKQVELKSIVRP
jgi:hypothetical protein